MPEQRAAVFACPPAPIVIIPPTDPIHDRLGSTDSVSTRSTVLSDGSSFLTQVRRCSSQSDGEQPLPYPISLTKETGCMEKMRLALKPICPSERTRYDRGIVIGNNTGPWIFSPLETLLASEHGVSSRREQACSPWQCYIHPEGQPYYSLKDSSNRFTYLTEANVAKQTIRRKLEQIINTMEEKAALLHSSIRIPADAEICLEIGDDEEWSYYAVDTENRCIFWLDSIDLSDCLKLEFGLESKEQFQHFLAIEFWTHVEHFPITQRQPLQGLEHEVMDILNYMNIDAMTSQDSHVPYGPAGLQSLMRSVKGFQDTKKCTTSSYVIFGLARTMSMISNEHAFNFHGFHGARLSVFQSVRGKPPTQNKHSLLMKCLSPLLFYAPTSYLWRVERLHIDGVIRQHWWQKFRDELDADLSGILILSTILLAANAAMLAAPDILSQVDPIVRSAAVETANRVSAVSSLGGILIGLQLKVHEIRVNSKCSEDSMSHAISYLSQSKHRRFHLESLAIHFSLPYAMLMWSVVTFAISIALLSFKVTSGTPGPASRIVLAIFWFFTMASVFWSMLTGWEFANYSHWTDIFGMTRRSSDQKEHQKIQALRNAESIGNLSREEKAGEC